MGPSETLERKVAFGLGSQVRDHILRRFSGEWLSPVERMAEVISLLSKRGKPNPKHKEYWRLHHDEQLKKMMVGEHKRPNKVELKLIDIINRHALPFKYVGDWEFIIGGKCPDFLNTTGKRQLIELFGNYWHTIKARETAEERVNHLRKHGFETLILWEKELDDEPLIVGKILQFAGLA